MREYLFAVFAAAIICAIATRLMENKGTHGVMVKLIAGLFLTFTVISPFSDIRLNEWKEFTSDYAAAGKEAAEAGESLTKEAMAAVIKAQTEAYILDKATALDLEVNVEVTVSDERIPRPISVRLTGKASPYAKSCLETVIAQDMGIEKEHQLWT